MSDLLFFGLLYLIVCLLEPAIDSTRETWREWRHQNERTP